MKMCGPLILERAIISITVFSGSVTQEAVCDEMLVLLVKVFMSHDVRSTGVHPGAVRLKKIQNGGSRKLS